MAKPYEIHGIPENAWLEFEEPPDYAVIYERKDEDTFDRPYGLMPSDVRLWGQAEYWTTIEAALLMVGLSPDDYELYAVEKSAACNDDFVENGEYYYGWKYEYKFDSAKDYLFLFERSNLSPKAPPIEWVKYFNKKVRDVSVRPPFEPNYCNDWIAFFSEQLAKTNQPEDLINCAPVISAPSFDKDAANFPPELAIALQVWTAVSATDGKGKPKARIKAWLDSNTTLSNEAKKRIATVANWDKTGGATRSD